MFRFSLETALDVRAREEKIKMKELADKVAVERKIQNNINEMESKVTDSDQQLNQAKQSGKFTINQMKFASTFKEKMKKDLTLSNQELTTAKEKVAEKQQLLLAASKAKKTMEILKEREKKRYWEKLAKQEQHFMDEVASSLFIQKRI